VNPLAKTIDEIQEVLAICPCCGEIFRLVEGKFIFQQRRPQRCEYSSLVELEARVHSAEEKLLAVEERFEERLLEQGEKLAAIGRMQAKRKLRKIDPIFSGREIDPQDVKVIFDPIEYVIFHGLNSDEGVEVIELLSRSPETASDERILKSIESTVRKGDVGFETLFMRDDGSFEIVKE